MTPSLVGVSLVIGLLVVGAARGYQIEATKTVFDLVKKGSYFFTVTDAQAESCLNFHVINNRPLGYVDENGQPTGIHWEFLTALEARSGLCINKKLFPYARIWKSMEFGTHDGGIVFRSPDRDSLVDYIAPICTVQTLVIPRKEITLEKYDDLIGLTIGKVRGIRLDERFETDTNIIKLEMNSYDQLFKTIQLKRIDAIAGSQLALSSVVDSAAADAIDITGKLVLGERVQWLQFSKKSQHLKNIPILRKAVEELVHEGVFDAIISKYYGPN
jgi:ABC-type amino acid transport substrate-binding protein